MTTLSRTSFTACQSSVEHTLREHIQTLTDCVGFHVSSSKQILLIKENEARRFSTTTVNKTNGFDILTPTWRRSYRTIVTDLTPIVQPLVLALISCLQKELKLQQRKLCVNKVTKRCTKSAIVIYCLQLSSYLSNTTLHPWSTDGGASLFKCLSEMLTYVLLANTHRFVVQTEKINRVVAKINNKTSSNRLGASTLKSIYRFNYLHKFHTDAKQYLCRATHRHVSVRYSDVDRNPNAPINYRATCDQNMFIRLSMITLIVDNVVNMSSKSLFYLTAALLNDTRKRPDMLLDIDMQNFLQILVTAGRERLRRKIIQVNPRGCLCHAKCFGQIYTIDNIERRNSIIDEFYHVHQLLLICGVCRQTPTIDTSNSDKCRQMFSAINPTIASCSLDSTSHFRTVDFNPHAMLATNMTNYAHRFYIGSSLPLLNEDCQQLQNSKNTSQEYKKDDVFYHDLDDDNVSSHHVSEGPNKRKHTRSTKIHGICYRGSRTCRKQLIRTYASARVQPLSDINHWYKCSACTEWNRYTSNTSLFTAMTLGLDSDTFGTDNYKGVPHDLVTCLHMYFRGDLSAQQVCRGCKIAVRCFHFDVYFKDVKHSSRLTKKALLKLITLRCLQ